MSIWLQKSASIQKRTSPLKFDNFRWKIPNFTASYLSTKAWTVVAAAQSKYLPALMPYQDRRHHQNLPPCFPCELRWSLRQRLGRPSTTSSMTSATTGHPSSDSRTAMSKDRIEKMKWTDDSCSEYAPSPGTGFPESSTLRWHVEGSFILKVRGRFVACSRIANYLSIGLFGSLSLHWKFLYSRVCHRQWHFGWNHVRFGGTYTLATTSLCLPEEISSDQTQYQYQNYDLVIYDDGSCSLWDLCYDQDKMCYPSKELKAKHKVKLHTCS